MGQLISYLSSILLHGYLGSLDIVAADRANSVCCCITQGGKVCASYGHLCMFIRGQSSKVSKYYMADKQAA
jgi:hypothetical protein